MFITSIIALGAPHITVLGSVILSPLGILASITNTRIAIYTAATLVAFAVLGGLGVITKHKVRPALAQVHPIDE